MKDNRLEMNEIDHVLIVLMNNLMKKQNKIKNWFH